MGETRPPLYDWAIENLTEISLALAAAAGIVLLLYGVRAFILRASRRLGPQHAFASVLAATVRKTHLWFLAALAIALVENYLHPPQAVTDTIAFLFTVAAALQGAIWARTLTLGLIERRTRDDEGDATSLASAMGIIRLLVSVAVFAIAAIVVLDNLGANVTGLVAGLGIGGIAIGLAAQGIFSDLFAALSIIFDKPFRVGDVITYQGKEGPITGRVEQIGLKSTRIRSLTGELRIIGNTQLLAQEVTNYVGRQSFRFQLPFGVIYQTDPAVLAEIPGLLQAAVERRGHNYINAWLKAFGPSSINFEFLFEVADSDGGRANKALETVALDMVRIFNERGIQFAYPTRTHFTAAPDGTLVMPYQAGGAISDSGRSS
jgi:small-conductance mechanosensitive channel